MSQNKTGGQHCSHGLTGTKIYRIYHHMKDRCYRKTDKAYSHYGGRGITICDEWLGKDGVKNFNEWAYENGYSDDLSIERKDVNGNYCPENCCWIPIEKQAANRTNQNIITYRGETHHLTEWSTIIGIPQDTLWRRIFRFGWSVEKAFSKPVQKQIKDRICSVPGCGKPHKAKGYCDKHYQRFKIYGTPYLKKERTSQ
uniref:HNH endonuclease n=1 Tax=Dulem virus 39 TaxID=3145757 RepID=A0AAU8B7E7_9CAUD